MQHGYQEHAHGLPHVDHSGQLRRSQNRLRVTQVTLDGGNAVIGGQQGPDVGNHHRVVVP
jgi:hypothetical protein